MRRRQVVGRTIVEIGQTRFYNPQVGQTAVALDFLRLDNGKTIYFAAQDTDDTPYVEGFIR